MSDSTLHGASAARELTRVVRERERLRLWSAAGTIEGASVGTRFDLAVEWNGSANNNVYGLLGGVLLEPDVAEFEPRLDVATRYLASLRSPADDGVVFGLDEEYRESAMRALPLRITIAAQSAVRSSPMAFRALTAMLRLGIRYGGWPEDEAEAWAMWDRARDETGLGGPVPPPSD